MNELLKPFLQIFSHPPQQWHPILVHVPIVFLILEAILVWLYIVTQKPNFNQQALTSLKISFWSIWFVVLSGLHDNGLNPDGGNVFAFIGQGLKTRLDHLFHFQAALTVHFWLAGFLVILTLLRFIWRLTRARDLKGVEGFLYGIISLAGLWLMVTVAYVGGNISHI